MPSNPSVNALITPGHFTAADFAAADAIVADYFGRGGEPAIAYGIVVGGELAHSAGFGARVVGAGPPDADTVFRIASMSKSFTASAILLLRDAGALALDDPAERYVPELAGWTHGAADAAPVTIRQLLSMTAGFPTDDPWGDRQQGLPIPDFDALLAGGVSFNWAPGTRFEYSNLGYAILGRVINAAAETDYDTFITQMLLTPLGLSRTGFRADEFDPGNLAVGYRHGIGGWEELPFDPYGAFAPMGGVFSTVADLGRWVAGFAAAFPPDAISAVGDASTDGTHPLRPASRRQMQLPQAVTGWPAVWRLPGGPPAPPAYYGFGLFVDEDAALGRVVSHSGGYPGFGSNMRWHPATGIGVIALGNGTYAPMSPLTGLLLDALVPASHGYQVALAPAAAGENEGAPWPATLAAQEKVNRLLQDWDDAAADALFTENVAQDAPYSERRHTIGLIRDRIGPFAADEERPAESDTPAHRRWWLAGAHGTVQVQIQLSPERDPRVMSLTLAVPPAPKSLLARTVDALVGWLNASEQAKADWPADVPVAATADAALIERRLRTAAVWAGRCAPGAWQAGSGTASTTVELIGENATITLSVLVNRATGELRHAGATL